MKRWFASMLKRIDKREYYLCLAGTAMVFFLVVLDNLQLIHFVSAEFIFFFLIALAYAVYRPGWAFWIFCSLIVLENVNLAPDGLGLNARPYQFLAGALLLSLLINYLAKRERRAWSGLARIDYLVLLIPLSGLANIFYPSFHQAGTKFALILFSFAAIFMISRYFVDSLAELKKTLPFFLSVSVVAMLYGLWQNIRYAYNLDSFAVMPGRPNSVFPEPDWFGLYLVLILSFCYAMLYYLSQKYAKNFKESARKFLPWFAYLTMIISLLILSMSRSAWLGAAALTVIFLIYVFSNFELNFRKWKWWEAIRMKLFILTSIFLSFLLINLFQLTTFQIFNRVQSVGTGEQKITVSCLEDIALPNKIDGLDELNSFGCRHINLEEISAEKESGKYIREISRDDPNINVRAEIYGKAWQAIQAHPILGVGWENISPLLGRDGRGTYLNSSNIFLETWLGGGIISFLSLSLLLIMIIFRAFQKLARTKSLEQKIFALFVILSWIGAVIFNLFNAGIMLGFFWLWLGISSLILKKTDEDRD